MWKGKMDREEAYYKNIENEADRLGKKYEQFWHDFNLWDTSGYDSNRDLGSIYREAYYQNMADVVNRYLRRERKERKRRTRAFRK